MSCYYFDTSAFLKLWLPEKEQPLVRSYYEEADACVSSRLLLLETATALHCLRQERVLSAKEFKAAKERVTFTLERFNLLSMDSVVPAAMELLSKVDRLRSLDAIHLASTIQLSSTFICFDQRLRRAAAKLGLPLLPE